MICSTSLRYGALCVYVVLDKGREPAQTESSLFNMMKQEPFISVASSGHLSMSTYRGCSAGDDDLLSPSTSTAAAMMKPMPEKSYLVDDRGLLNGTAFTRADPGDIHPPAQMTRINGLRVNYANRGGTIRSYHCRLCRKVNTAVCELFLVLSTPVVREVTLTNLSLIHI